MRFLKACSVLAFAAALALLFAGSAHAQMPGSGGAARMPPPVKKPGQTQADNPAPPPALPGAQNNFAPAERTATDLSPNDALFDAINRGDIAAARDSINRGADLGAKNLLGMTPLEVSVDLSRNNITFLLLSMRGPTAPAPRHASVPAAVAGAAGAKSATGSAAPVPKKLAAVPPRKPAPSAAPPAQPVALRQYAGPSNPGTPVPQAGFLGFGGATP